MNLGISTPALLFPAVSLLFLSYTNCFLHLSALIRELHRDWVRSGEATSLAQIENIRHRLMLIRWMQLFGAAALVMYRFDGGYPYRAPRVVRAWLSHGFAVDEALARVPHLRDLCLGRCVEHSTLKD